MDIYNVIFYIFIFIIGTLFGSFYTLAVYRIPKKQDITHTHSYCPNCNHKLGILDLIPVWSYIFLRGKCRYCKNKIRPRYFILEVLSGLAFVALAYFVGLNFYNITWNLVIEYSFAILYLTFLVLMAVTEKENRRIEKSISVYGIVISLMYIVYLWILDTPNIYGYAMYLIFYILVLIYDSITLKKRAKDSYATGIILTALTMAVFTKTIITISTIIYVLLIVFIYMLLKKLTAKSKKARQDLVKKDKDKTLPVGFFLGVANIITCLVALVGDRFLI